jgi:hypothetical protein
MGEDRGDGRSRTILGALGLTITLNDDVRARFSAGAAWMTAGANFTDPAPQFDVPRPPSTPRFAKLRWR